MAILDLKEVAKTLSPRTVGIVTVFLISFASISQIGAIVGTIRALSENKEASYLNLVGKCYLHQHLLLFYPLQLLDYLFNKNHPLFPLVLDVRVIFL